MIILYHYITILHHKMMNFFKWRDVSGICCLSRMFVFMLIFLFVYTFHVDLFVCLYYLSAVFLCCLVNSLAGGLPEGASAAGRHNVQPLPPLLPVCTNTIWYLQRYNSVFGQIKVGIWTNTIWYLDKYNLIFGGCRENVHLMHCATFASFGASQDKFNLVIQEILFGIWTNTI